MLLVGAGHRPLFRDLVFRVWGFLQSTALRAEMRCSSERVLGCRIFVSFGGAAGV